MSLEAELAAESKHILSRIDSRPGTMARGRRSVDRSMSPHSQIRSPSRGRNRGISGDRRSRGASRARSQGEDVNYKWSILFHDPSDRFVNGDDAVNVPPGGEDDEDDISEEEQISDDEQDFDYDIHDLRLPNYGISINEYHSENMARKFRGGKNKSSDTSKMTSSFAKSLTLNNDSNRVKIEGEKLEKLSEALALEKGLEDAKNLGSKVPKKTYDEASKKLQDAGVDMGMSIDKLIEIENSKEKKYEAYKKNVIDESKASEADELQAEKSTAVEQQERIVQSEVDVNEENLRVSRSVTLGRFFTRGLTNSQIRSYLLYTDLSSDSLSALQYTIGAVVKSGDVLYIINTANNDHSLGFYKNQLEKLTESVKTFMNLIGDPNFKLHVVIESINQEYPKHFLNELIKYLKPSLLIVCYRIILNELSNYMSNIPLMIIKRRSKRRKSTV